MALNKFMCERPPAGIKLSAPEKGRLNKRNFCAYVKHLEASELKFPINQFGDINLSVISEQCGFQRQVFANNKALKADLDNAVRRIGTDVMEGQDTESRLDNDLKIQRKQLSDARRDLALAEEKIDGLQRQLVGMNTELKRSQESNEEATESLDYMISTGRRFTL
jgi:chromosome segregation ATPase